MDSWWDCRLCRIMCLTLAIFDFVHCFCQCFGIVFELSFHLLSLDQFLRARMMKACKRITTWTMKTMPAVIRICPLPAQPVSTCPRSKRSFRSWSRNKRLRTKTLQKKDRSSWPYLTRPGCPICFVFIYIYMFTCLGPYALKCWFHMSSDFQCVVWLGQCGHEHFSFLFPRLSRFF